MCSSLQCILQNKQVEHFNHTLSSQRVLKSSVLQCEVTHLLLLLMFKDQINGIWLFRGQCGGGWRCTSRYSCAWEKLRQHEAGLSYKGSNVFPTLSQILISLAWGSCRVNQKSLSFSNQKMSPGSIFKKSITVQKYISFYLTLSL